MKEPKGRLEVVECRLTRPNHKAAVYIEVIFRDEEGDFWSKEFSTFYFDLKYRNLKELCEGCTGNKAISLAGGPHSCKTLGHKWIFHGGSSCGCEEGKCSIPVYRCSGCGDYDYGNNEESEEIRKKCAENRDP